MQVERIRTLRRDLMAKGMEISWNSGGEKIGKCFQEMSIIQKIIPKKVGEFSKKRFVKVKP